MNENPIAFYLLIFLAGHCSREHHFFGLLSLLCPRGVKRLGTEILHRAEQEAEELRKGSELSLKQKQLEQQRELEQLWQQERKKSQREEERLKQREDKLESRMNLVEKKLSDIEKREAILLAAKFN